MPKYANRVDGTQKATVKALRKLKCSVVHLTAVKAGVPDLLVGINGMTVLIECKDPDGRNRIEQSQKDFAASWKGCPILYVRSPDDAVEQLLDAIRYGPYNPPIR